MFRCLFRTCLQCQVFWNERFALGIQAPLLAQVVCYPSSAELILAHSSPPRIGSETSHVGPEISDALVREELDRVLASREFQASKLCQNFLRYVVESRLNGHSDTLKERTIGIEVFSKLADYDPSEDAGVRVKAGEVRKRLRSYYVSPLADTKVLIDLPPGTYVPEFRTMKREGLPALAGPRTRSRLLVIGTVVLAALAATGLLWLRSRRPAPTSVDQFWAPVFQSKRTVLLCTAPVPVYSLIGKHTADQPPLPEDFALIPNRFLAVSDVNAATQIADMLARAGQSYRLRIGGDVSFRDMRAAPVILVGFSYTQWHEIGEHFRYSIDLSRRPFGIWQDTNPTNWTIQTHPDDPDLNEDYAIISRVLYPGTKNIIVEITGISHYGTEAAADLVTNPALLEDVLRKLPTGWQEKNIQIVLHVEVVSGSPSVPAVVATHLW